MVWKTGIPLLICEYVMSGLMVATLLLPDDSADVISNSIFVIFFVLTFISLFLMALHLMFALKDNRKTTRETLVSNLIYQFLLAPVTLFAFFFVFCFVITGTVTIFSIYFLVSLPLFAIAGIVFVYQSILVVASSLYSLSFLLNKRRDENFIFLVTHAVIQLFFIANIVDTIYLLNYFKKDQSSLSE